MSSRTAQAPAGPDTPQDKQIQQKGGVAQNLAAFRWLFMAKKNASGTARNPGRALLIISPVVLATAAIVVLGANFIGPRQAALAGRLREYTRVALEAYAHKTGH